jgi:two-component system, NarL family, sensor histidine kinase UhpB
MATSPKDRSRRESERVMRAGAATVEAILAAVDARIAVLDGRGTIVLTNAAWDRFGKVRAAAGTAPMRRGDNYLEILESAARDGNPSAAGAAECVRKVIRAGRRAGAIDYSLETSGGTHWVTCSVTPMKGGGGSVVVSHHDITDRVEGHVALELAHERLHALSRRVLSIQEEERRTISRELHDDLGQTLAALKIGLHRLQAKGGQKDPDLLAQCLSATEEVIERLRTIARELRPPQLDPLGLADAMAWLAERQARVSGVKIECDVDGLDGARPPAGVENACYRIAQEAINNATRHAGAKAVKIALRRKNRELELSVRDDGRGFDPQLVRARASGNLGLTTMEERAQLAGGRLEIRSTKGRGTTITAVFPDWPGGAK